MVSFRFRTFDENALLFFNGNPVTRDYVAIYLKDGRVQYECPNGSDGGSDGESMLIKTGEKINNGEWVQLRAERENNICLLKVNNNEIMKNMDRSGTLNLANTDVYFGGVTPNFTSTDWPKRIEFKSFVGCFNSPQIDTAAINFQSIPTFGIEPGCSNKAIKLASFKQEGYLELNGLTLSEKVEFSFTFKTVHKNGVLILSTFEGQDESRRKGEVSSRKN